MPCRQKILYLSKAYSAQPVGQFCGLGVGHAGAHGQRHDRRLDGLSSCHEQLSQARDTKSHICFTSPCTAIHKQHMKGGAALGWGDGDNSNNNHKAVLAKRHQVGACVGGMVRCIVMHKLDQLIRFSP